MAQILDDFLGNMRKVRPSGAIAPLQQDVTEMGRSINPMGKPKAVSLPALGGDRLGMPSGYGEEGTTERADTTVAQTSSVRGQVPKFEYPAYPEFNYPGMPEHTQFPALPREWQPPALPSKVDPNSFPPYPDVPKGGPLRDVLPYANILRAGVNLGVPLTGFSGMRGTSNALKMSTHVINPVVSGLNIYNAWNDPTQTTAQRVGTTLNETARSGPQLLADFGNLMVKGGAENAGGWIQAVGAAGVDYAPYANLALSGYNAVTAKDKGARGKGIMDTAMAGIALATAEASSVPYAGLFMAGAQLAQTGVQMYKNARDERQWESPAMRESRLRTAIKYALDRQGKVNIDDVLSHLTAPYERGGMGMTLEQANEYLDKTNFYSPLRAVKQNGVWGGDWEDWRVNRMIVQSAGDMSGVEGGASIRDVIMNRTGIKPIKTEWKPEQRDPYFDMTAGGMVMPAQEQAPNYDFGAWKDWYELTNQAFQPSDYGAT